MTLPDLLADAEDPPELGWEDGGGIEGAMRGDGIIPRNEGRLERWDELEPCRCRDEEDGPAEAFPDGGRRDAPSWEEDPRLGDVSGVEERRVGGGNDMMGDLIWAL
jgi:hypothetical protein